jgi:alcohol dehydrogenase class IV
MPRHADELATGYDFAMPPMIRFGAGRIGEIGELVGIWGREAWIVGGGRSLIASGASNRIDAALAAAGIPHRLVATAAGEPTVDHVAGALASLPQGDRSGVVVVAVGGGSTIDLAKAVAALAPLLPAGAAADGLDSLVVDHLEGVGRGRAIRHWPLPVVAVPTTAGTGAEATRNAVISCPRRGFKKSMRSPLMVPRAALVDPELTASCDRGTIIASGLDCITQLIESYLCRFARPLPRALVLQALPGALEALPRLLTPPASPAAHGDDRAAARAAMSHAALVSGMALANSGLGLAHGVAAALGIACGTPHGLACATMLPATLRVNRPACGHDLAALERAADPSAPPSDDEAADAFVDRIDRLCADAPRRLGEIGVRADQLDWLAENSGGNSMRGNPVQIDTAAVRKLLAGML